MRCRLVLLGFLVQSIAAASTVSASDSVRIPVPDGSDEIHLRIDYDLACADDATGFGAVRGEIRLPDRTVRFDLYRGNHRVDLLLGRVDRAEVEARVAPSETCRTSRLAFAAERVRFGTGTPDLVARYSPFFVVRKNQVGNRDTDVPVALTYNVYRPDDSRRIIQYNLYYTDEDSKSGKAREESQMTRYGRRLDIQWAYRVEVDAAGKKLHEWFQGGIFRTGIGHQTLRFRGKFLPGTDHPVLYDISDHNAYSDRPCFGLHRWIGYHPAETIEVPRPVAREATLFDRPWLLAASDRELDREGKLAHPTEDYLYVLVHGRITRGSLLGALELADGTRFLSGGGTGSFDRLGEDTWGEEAYTAIPVGEARLAELFGETPPAARFSFVPKSIAIPRASFESPRFFVVERDGEAYRTREVTERFVCDAPEEGLPDCVLGPVPNP